MLYYEDATVGEVDKIKSICKRRGLQVDWSEEAGVMVVKTTAPELYTSLLNKDALEAGLTSRFTTAKLRE